MATIEIAGVQEKLGVGATATVFNFNELDSDSGSSAPDQHIQMSVACGESGETDDSGQTMDRRLSDVFEHNDIINNRVRIGSRGHDDSIERLYSNVSLRSCDTIGGSSSHASRLAEERSRLLEEQLRETETENGRLRIRLAEFEARAADVQPPVPPPVFQAEQRWDSVREAVHDRVVAAESTAGYTSKTLAFGRVAQRAMLMQRQQRAREKQLGQASSSVATSCGAPPDVGDAVGAAAARAAGVAPVAPANVWESVAWVGSWLGIGGVPGEGSADQPPNASPSRLPDEEDHCAANSESALTTLHVQSQAQSVVDECQRTENSELQQY